MADHVVCVTVRIRNESGNAENLVSRRIGRFSNKLSLEDMVKDCQFGVSPVNYSDSDLDICNEVIGESDLDPSIN